MKLSKLEHKMKFAFSVMLVISAISSIPMLFVNFQIGIALLSSAKSFFIVIVYMEVRGLKDWGNKNVSDLVKGAEVAARSAYKLKQHKGLNLVINGNRVLPNNSNEGV